MIIHEPKNAKNLSSVLRHPRGPGDSGDGSAGRSFADGARGHFINNFNNLRHFKSSHYRYHCIGNRYLVCHMEVP